MFTLMFLKKSQNSNVLANMLPSWQTEDVFDFSQGSVFLTLVLGLNVLVSEMSLYTLHTLDGGGGCWDRAH